MRLLALLQLLLALTAHAAVPTHYISVPGSLDNAVIANLVTNPNITRILRHPRRSIIEIHGSPVSIAHVLMEHNMDHIIEANMPAAVDTTTHWNLDRMDEAGYPLDGKFIPPGTGKDITIYVLDTGVNIGHDDFGGRASRDATWKDEEPCASDHGSWTASIAAGSTFGVARLANVVDVKLPTGASCDMTCCDIVAALVWLLSKPPPFVVSMSVSCSVFSATINQLCDDLRSHGAVVVVSAGNGGSATEACDRSPASSSAAITVASIDEDTDERSSFSNYRDCVNIFAPGENVQGAGRASSVATFTGSGTSASAPHVAGEIAVLFQQYDLALPDEVEAKMRELSLEGVVVNSGGSVNRLINFSDAGRLTPTHLLLTLATLHL